MRTVLILATCLLVTALRAVYGQDQWLGVFPKYPGARRLCDGHVTGSSGGQHVEIAFTLHGSADEPSEVVCFYAEAHRLPRKPGQTTINVRPNDGPNLLSVQPVSASYPDCGVKPMRADRTIIVVSEMHSIRTP